MAWASDLNYRSRAAPRGPLSTTNVVFPTEDERRFGIRFTPVSGFDGLSAATLARCPKSRRDHGPGIKRTFDLDLIVSPAPGTRNPVTTRAYTLARRPVRCVSPRVMNSTLSGSRSSSRAFIRCPRTSVQITLQRVLAGRLELEAHRKNLPRRCSRECPASVCRSREPAIQRAHRRRPSR